MALPYIERPRSIFGAKRSEVMHGHAIASLVDVAGYFVNLADYVIILLIMHISAPSDDGQIVKSTRRFSATSAH